MPEFKTFTKQLVARSRDPRATIQKGGTITLNAAAHALLGSPGAVELLFDGPTRRVGLRPCGTDVSHATQVRPAGKSPGGPFVVSDTTFLRQVGVDTTDARRLPVYLDADVLCIDLDGESQVVSKTPPPRRPLPPRKN